MFWKTKTTSLLLVCGFLTLATGCGSGPNTAAYIPSDAVARDALSTALEAWKNGKQPGRIENAAVEVVDHQWQAGMKLQKYESLEEVPGEGPKRIRVRLTLDSRGTKEATYVIVGRNPLWVFRQEDYRKVEGM
jgi:hypothetical protein